MNSEFETRKKNVLATFVKEHKKEIAITALTVGTIVIGIIIYKKCNVPLETEHLNVIHLGMETANGHITDLLSDVETGSKTINVPEYIRKLPKDFKHSQEAVELAKKYMGYDLPDDETFVQPYSYSKMSA